MTDKQIVDLYNKVGSMAAVAQFAGTNATKVRAILVRNGIKIGPTTGRSKVRKYWQN